MKPVWISLLLILLASVVRGETLVANARSVLTGSTGITVQATLPGRWTILVDPSSPFWSTLGVPANTVTNIALWAVSNAAPSGITKLVGNLYVPLVINPEHNSMGGSTTNNLAVVLDFTQFTATNAVLAWGAYSSSASAQQEFYRGALFRIPETCQAFGTTALVMRVFGSTTSAETNKVDVLITDRASGRWYATNGLVTATNGDWTDIAILSADTMFTNAMSGKTLHVRINPFCWAGTTAAVDTVVQVYGK